MKKIKFIITLNVLLSILSTSLLGQQIADTNFNYIIKTPLYNKGKGTTITLDEAHYNFHTLSGRYYSFGQLLQKDGYVLKPGNQTFTSSYLSTIKILVIANALADTGEWKLPAKPAFSKKEIIDLNKWVSDGGSLFLIADHMPFPGAAEHLALSFGFNFIDAYALRKDKGPQIFSRTQKNLTSNKITNGRNNSEHIDSIQVFTGQGFIAPENATIISKLNDDYKIVLPLVAGEFNDSIPSFSGHGLVNGAFLEYGKGRIVVFGEAAMFSAQLSGPQQNKMGMNNQNAKQNPQFLINIIHWLDRKL